MENKKGQKIINVALTVYIAIVGFLYCQNIIVPLKINSTPFNISILLVIPLIIVLLLFCKINPLSICKKIPLSFYVFLSSLIISLIPGLIISSKIGGILPSIKGLIFYVLNSLLPIILCILIPKEKRSFLFLGLLTGFFANLIISVVVHIVFYTTGYSLTLNKLFVNSSFFVPDYFASAQGLFLEPSHLAGYLLVLYYVLFWYYKSPKIRLILTISSWILFLLYGMGNLFIFLISQLIFFCYYFKTKYYYYLKSKVFNSKLKTIIFFASLGCLVILVFVLCFGPLKTKIINILDEMNPFGSKNKERLNSIVVGMNIFLQHPFGLGFNLSGKYISVNYSDVLNTPTVFSYFLKILMELGVFGIASFLVFCFVLIKTINKKVQGGFVLSLAFISGILFAFLDGPNEPYLYMSIGIMFYECGFNTNVLNVVKQIKNRRSFPEYIEIDI